MDESKAIQQYTKHLQRVRKYNESHKEQLNEKAKSYYKDKIKSDPEKYKKYLEDKKEYNKNRRLKIKENLTK